MATRDKGDGAKAVHVFFGSDADKVSSECRALVEKLCPPQDQALGLEVIDGAVDNADMAIEAIRKTLAGVQTVGFFGASRTVWLKDISFLGDSRQATSEAVRAELAKLGEEIKRGLMEGQSLILSAPSIDKRTVFAKLLVAHAAMHESNVPERGREVEEFTRDAIDRMLDELGLRMDAGAVQSLIERVGPDTRMLRQEINKLDLYLGDRRQATQADVALLIAPSREAPGWDITEAIAQRKLGPAVKLLRQLFFQKVSPIMLLAVIERSVRLWIVVKDCMQRRLLRPPSGRFGKAEWSVDADADRCLQMLDPDPRTVHPFRVVIATEQAARFTMAELLAMQRDVLLLHEQARSSAVPAELLLEFAILKWLAPTNTRSAA